MNTCPERKKKAPKEQISSFRHNDISAAQLAEILNDNPLYSPSVVIRGALLAIHRMPKDEREAVILDAANR
jgi:hypothetical protein